jgi:cellulose synthase/poly-beta-1,6-N-acetylglucosamine synthase-like glycosyltransferase
MDQIFYIIKNIFSFLVLFLFIRFLIWGWWAEKTYWIKKPKLSIKKLQKLFYKRKLPMITILLPAYKESLVISNTIERLSQLNYPANLFEIIIITDEKEFNINNELTTQEVVEQKIMDFNKKTGLPFIRHLIVPKDFDGQLNGFCLGKIVPSTKGRALNFALPFCNKQTEICAFYDADSRPNQDVLLYVAYSYLKNNGRIKIWQGPVYQVRNFFQLYPINKIAALHQSISHEWSLPVIMNQLPFVGGTNFFITSKLLNKIGGFDYFSLTEDLELGVRAYIKTGAWPEYIPYPSTEQTPSTYYSFFRQRLRWGSGYLQVMEKLLQINTQTEIQKKRVNNILNTLFWKGPIEWIFFQTIILFPIIVFLLNLIGFITVHPLFTGVALILNITILIYFIFTFERLKHFSPFINFDLVKNNHFKKILAILHLLIIPIAGFFLIIPFIASFILKIFRKQPSAWIKTPRTVEN